MALGASDIANGEIYLRSNQAFNSSPMAVWAPERHGYNHQSWGRWHIQMLVCELHRLRCRNLVRWQFLTRVITIPAVAGLGLFRLTQRTLFGPGMVGVADKWRHGSASHYNPWARSAYLSLFHNRLDGQASEVELKGKI